jgi:hypothetical protein
VDPVNKTRDNLALKGYDPVAYFKDARHVKGSSQITHSWMDATWRFASEKNRELFRATPECYAPQFGGYCALAVSNDFTADIDPQAWTIWTASCTYSTELRKKWEAEQSARMEAGQAYEQQDDPATSAAGVTGSWLAR